MIAGRVVNRIANATFTLDGKQYQVHQTPSHWKPHMLGSLRFDLVTRKRLKCTG